MKDLVQKLRENYASLTYNTVYCYGGVEFMWRNYGCKDWNFDITKCYNINIIVDFENPTCNKNYFVEKDYDVNFNYKISLEADFVTTEEKALWMKTKHNGTLELNVRFLFKFIIFIQSSFIFTIQFRPHEDGSIEYLINRNYSKGFDHSKQLVVKCDDCSEKVRSRSHWSYELGLLYSASIDERKLLEKLVSDQSKSDGNLREVDEAKDSTNDEN